MPRLCRLRTLMKSSRNPIVAIARMPTQTISAWVLNGRPSRTWADIQPTRAATRMAIPPIVGVPCLAMWCSGPRSSLPRIGWPRPRVRNIVISARVANSDTRPATTPAIMTAITARPPSDEDGAGDVAVVERQHSVADRLSRLVTLAGDDHDVARLGQRDRQLDRRRAVELDLDAASGRRRGCRRGSRR